MANYCATCPVCGKYSVRVRSRAAYMDGEIVEAYCLDCDTELRVHACVSVTFSEPEEIRDDDRARDAKH